MQCCGKVGDFRRTERGLKHHESASHTVQSLADMRGSCGSWLLTARLARSNLSSSLARVCLPPTGGGGTTAAPADGLLRVPSRTAGASRQGAPLRGRGCSKRTRGAVADPRLYGAGCQGKSLITHQDGLSSAHLLLVDQHSTCAHTIQVSGMLIQGVKTVPHLHRHGCQSTRAAQPSFLARA